MKKEIISIAIVASLVLSGAVYAAPQADLSLLPLATSSNAEFHATPSNATSSNATAAEKTDEKHVKLPLPVKAGYRFVEWNTAEDGTGTAYQAGEEVEITSVKLYAIWQEFLLATPSNATPSDATPSNATPSDMRATYSDADRATWSDATRATWSDAWTASDSDAFDEEPYLPDIDLEEGGTFWAKVKDFIEIPLCKNR